MWTQALNFCEVISGIHSTEKRDRVDWRDQTQPSRAVPRSSCLLEVFIRLLSERVLRTWCPLQSTRSSPPFFPLSPLHLPSHPSSKPHSTIVFSISLSKIGNEEEEEKLESDRFGVQGSPGKKENHLCTHSCCIHSRNSRGKEQLHILKVVYVPMLHKAKQEHLRSKHN